MCRVCFVFAVSVFRSTVHVTTKHELTKGHQPWPWPVFTNLRLTLNDSISRLDIRTGEPHRTRTVPRPKATWYRPQDDPLTCYTSHGCTVTTTTKRSMREHLLATTSSARPLFPRRSAAPPRPPPLSHHLPTTLEGWILSRALAQIAHEIRAGNVLDGRRAARRFGALTRRAAARRAVPARALRRVRVCLRHRRCHRDPAGSGSGR